MQKLLLTAVSLFLTVTVWATPISEQQAHRIALNFFAQSATRSTVSVDLVWSGDRIAANEDTRAMNEEGLLYIYNCNDVPGFVIVAGEDQARPIVAFSLERTFDMKNMAPAARSLLDAWCKQLAAVRSGDFSVSKKTASVGTPVREYATALWGQSAPYNNEIRKYMNAPTGCVATAFAILCYYHQWPKAGVGTTPAYEYSYNGVQATIPANELGRTYDYSKMLFDYSNGYTSEQGAAVAALMHDVGTATQILYSPTESGGSDYLATEAMMTYFGYSKGAFWQRLNMYSGDDKAKTLQHNLDNYGPTCVVGSSASGSHAFILDGYTTEDYFRINYGWNGSSNGYYLLPDCHYSNVYGTCLCLQPDREGTSSYRDNLCFQSFKLVNENDGKYGKWYQGLESSTTRFRSGKSFSFSIGSIVNQGFVDFVGQIKLSLCNESRQEKEVLFIDDVEIERYAAHGLSGLSATITRPIVEGDRLCVFCKGRTATEWTRICTWDAYSTDEILLYARPEEVAKALSITCNKHDRVDVWLTAPYAMQYSVKKITTGEIVELNEVRGYNNAIFDISDYGYGEYLFSITMGGKPYEVTIVF